MNTPEVIRTSRVSSPELSVVVSVYNAEKFIGEAVRSILGQHGMSFEVVILDDASSDDSPRILGEFDDERITLLRLDGREHVSAARNRAFEYVRAPWMCVFDADDIMLPDTLQPYFEAVSADGGTAWGYCALETVDEEGNPLGHQMRNPWDILKLLQRNIIPHPMALVRCDLFRRAGGYDESLPAQIDYDLWLRLLDWTEPLYFDRVCLRYRRHAGTLGSTCAGAHASAVHRNFRARLGQAVTDANVKRRRTVLRRAVAFLDAAERQESRALIDLGVWLMKNGVSGFELDRLLGDALRVERRFEDAFGVAAGWLRRIADGETVLPYETCWAVSTGLGTALSLRNRDRVGALLPFARQIGSTMGDEGLRKVIGACESFLG